jgi:hypothetical protein
MTDPLDNTFESEHDAERGAMRDGPAVPMPPNPLRPVYNESMASVQLQDSVVTPVNLDRANRSSYDTDGFTYVDID